MATEIEKVHDERGDQYGDFSQVAFDSQTLREILVSARMTSVQRESMQMICTKLARISNGNPNNRDSWFDIAGYVMLAVKDIDSRQLVPPVV